MRRLLLICGLFMCPALAAQDIDARQLVQSAMDQWRGVSSYSEMTMTIHHADWERSMTLRAWSQGTDLSLVRVIEPSKDAGNGTLVNKNNMWTYSPRINRIIKVPSSMMSQSWMGSDFSNKDISKSTAIINEYDHALTAQENRDGHVLYTVTSTPHEDAAVVWGKEVLVIRDDFLLLEQQFWDQDGVLVKSMNALEVKNMGGRAVASILRMGKRETPDEWTEIKTHSIEFDIELADTIFTLSNLRNPRQ